MTTHTLEFGHFLVMPLIPSLSLSSGLHGMALASPYNPIFLLCYGRVFFQGFTFALAGLLGTLFGYGSFFFLIHEGITGPLYLWYKLEPLLCLVGAVAISVSALNLSVLRNRRGNTFFSGDLVIPQGYPVETYGAIDSSDASDVEVPGSQKSRLPLDSDQIYKRYQEIFFFHYLLAWSNPASLCLSSQSSIADAEMGLGSCFFGMVAMTNILGLGLWFLLGNQRRINIPGIQGWFRDFFTFQWIPYWIIGLTVTSLSQMTWHLFVHYPLEYTQLSSIQRNFDTEVPRSVRRHDPFLRLQDMMRRYPGLKDTEFSQTQRERAYIRYNTYPLNVITRGLRMTIFSWRNLNHLEREPYEVYHLQQLKNVFDTQSRSFDKPLDLFLGSSGDLGASSSALTSGINGRPEGPGVYPRVWKNKEKGNPQFAYSRTLPLSSNTSLDRRQVIDLAHGPVTWSDSNSVDSQVNTVKPETSHGSDPRRRLVTGSQGYSVPRWNSQGSQGLVHDDIAFLVTLFRDNSDVPLL